MINRFCLRKLCLVSVLASLLATRFAGAPATGAPALALAHHRVSTANPNAQREFDLGLTMMYAFNPEEASHDFAEAARLDGNLAMAYWGIALAAGPNINTTYDLQRAELGRAALAQARRLEGHADAAERGYIEALAPRYDVRGPESVAAAQQAYARAMGALAQREPSDLDAQTLYAESLMDLTPLHMWEHDGRPARYTLQVIRILNGVLRRDPKHLGANHYLIHAYEDSKMPQAALSAARVLASLNLPPGAEHLAHMPAHIFTRVGAFEEAVNANRKAIAMFQSYLPAEHSNVHNGYYHHDFQVMNYAYMMSGQWANALEATKQIENQVGDNAAGVETFLRFHRWQELLALTPPAQPDLRWRFASAMASAATGDLESARAGVAYIDGLHDRDPRTGIALATLQAQIDIANHHAAAAISQLRRAVALQDTLPSREPPAWYYPVRETLGARLVLAGRPADGATVFRQDLQQNPNNPRSLFGLSQALRAMHSPQAAQVTARFTAAWRYADTPLTLEGL